MEIGMGFIEQFLSNLNKHKEKQQITVTLEGREIWLVLAALEELENSFTKAAAWTQGSDKITKGLLKDIEFLMSVESKIEKEL